MGIVPPSTKLSKTEDSCTMTDITFRQELCVFPRQICTDGLVRSGMYIVGESTVALNSFIMFDIGDSLCGSLVVVTHHPNGGQSF
jgi:hypothetical protein